MSNNTDKHNTPQSSHRVTLSPDLNAYIEIASVTRAVHRIEFPETQRGMVGYLVTWYENAKAERGTKSDPLEFVII